MRIAIIAAMVAAACGDNYLPPSKSPDIGFPIDDIDLGSGCADFDINVTCPDASLPPPDAAEELDEETKAACCHALLDGTPPNHECGYPPGLCKNGRKTMFCRDSSGADAQFELCNP